MYICVQIHRNVIFGTNTIARNNQASQSSTKKKDLVLMNKTPDERLTRAASNSESGGRDRQTVLPQSRKKYLRLEWEQSRVICRYAYACIIVFFFL